MRQNFFDAIISLYMCRVRKSLIFYLSLIHHWYNHVLAIFSLKKKNNKILFNSCLFESFIEWNFASFVKTKSPPTHTQFYIYDCHNSSSSDQIIQYQAVWPLEEFWKLVEDIYCRRPWWCNIIYTKLRIATCYCYYSLCKLYSIT